MLDRLDFILGMRLPKRPAVLGAVFLGVLVVSLLLFLLFGNGKVDRVLFFPSESGRRLLAEERFLPRHRGVEQSVSELAESVLLGPTRHDATRLFPRGGSVITALARGKTAFIDLSSALLLDDPEVPLKGHDALDALARTIRFNFPRFREIVFYIDGQVPQYPDEKKI
jgi:hypothetical protein